MDLVGKQFFVGCLSENCTVVNCRSASSPSNDCYMLEPRTRAKLTMALLGYTVLEQKESIEDPESHTIGPPPTIQDRCHAFVKNALSTILNAVSLIAAVLGLVIIAGFVASKVFVWSLVMLDQPGLLPEAFFPNCL